MNSISLAIYGLKYTPRVIILIGSNWMLIHGGINSNEEVLSDTAVFNIEK